jgi:hypothetical protein
MRPGVTAAITHNYEPRPPSDVIIIFGRGTQNTASLMDHDKVASES